MIFYSSQIAIALSCLHSFGVLYRDLKPENIVIDEEGYIKLIDFGSSHLLGKDEINYEMSGNLYYLSPECILGEGVEEASDWWTLGVLLYELLTGKLPFFSSSLDSLFDKILYSAVRYPKDYNISAKAKDLIDKAIS